LKRSDEIISEYGDPDDDIYGYVTEDVVNKLLEKHGGIDWEKILIK
jgi:hypothetical protein